MGFAQPAFFERNTMMNSSIIIRRGLSIGHPEAESDDEFIRECFLDSDAYRRALDLSDQGSILLGRTGSGKSAIIRHIQENEKDVITLSPEDLSFNFISSSKVISFFEDAGVHLDPFYILLWKHILSVELLRYKFQIKNEESQSNFLSRLVNIFSKDKSKEQALKYLQKWGEQFWNETEYRVKEFTNKFEEDLTSGLSAGMEGIKASIESGRKLTDEEKGEVVNIGQQAVNRIQIRDLHRVIELLSQDIFIDTSERYYVCIDRLDEDWVNDNMRFKLLKALIETIRSFRKIRNVKIVVAMRTDLHIHLMNSIKSYGFQREKYESYYLQVKWNREQLIEIVNRRIKLLFRHKYTKDNVTISDIFSNDSPTAQKSGIDYIIDRTFFRPRELIAFVNKCLDRATGKSKITYHMIRDCETIYSRDRFNALCDEWRREYPFLKYYCHIINGQTIDFLMGDIDSKKIETSAMLIYESYKGIFGYEAPSYIENAASDGQLHSQNSGGYMFCAKVIQALYQVGILGIKLTPSTPRIFSFDDPLTIELSQINLDVKLTVHKTFHNELGIKYDHRKQ